MRRKIMQFAVVLFALTELLNFSAHAAVNNPIIRVGLYYGSSALPSANLENSVDSGYYFGYFTGDYQFVSLGQTAETQISMLKTQNMYLQSGAYTDQQPSSGSYQEIGCYHLQLPGSYNSFEEAKAAADSVSGGFPAWINGTYYVRAGAYCSKDAAVAAQGSLGMETSVVGTTSYGVSVLKTKTTKILFQFDGGASISLGVKPGCSGTLKPVTWFKGFRYYGAFRYERLDGGNLTVVNLVALEDYIKGVVPSEMGPTWPIEALKSQAVCARTYTMITMGKHERYHFDLCNTTDCQAYKGLNGATELTNCAVEETMGICAIYNGRYAQTYYHSSDGGATEDVRNIWDSNSELPYLSGVLDPHEALVADIIPQYCWTVNYTKAELTERLRSKGYNCASIVDFRISEFTPTGNVRTVTFLDSNGEEWSFSKERVRSHLGLRSVRFAISGGGKYYVDGPSNALSSVIGAYAINGSGSIAQVAGAEGPYVITAQGTQPLQTTGSDLFTITGTGWGHNVGMSQWGAYSMAKQGYTYDQILKFYFTGIDVY